MCGYLHMPPTGDLACNPGMCPDWESNQWPFGSQAGTQPLMLEILNYLPHVNCLKSWSSMTPCESQLAFLCSTFIERNIPSDLPAISRFCSDSHRTAVSVAALPQMIKSTVETIDFKLCAWVGRTSRIFSQQVVFFYLHFSEKEWRCSACSYSQV